jgi:hypothetical protein
MTDTTRIVDLPENTNYSGTMGMPERTRKEEGNNFSTSYAPIDMHPNPYGHPPPSIPVPPASSQPYQQRLPSRDIPMDSTFYTNDEQVQPNYIPPLPASTRMTNEYMKQYDEHNEAQMKLHNDKKTRLSRIEELIENGQIPLLVSIIFFIFHIPVVNHYIFRHLSFLSIYDMDGNFNIYGLILKSSLFGGVYFGISQIIHFLSEF